MRNGCGQSKGRLRLERARRSAVGVRWEPTAAVPTLAETTAWARSIPRAGHQAQGFTRLADFARHVKQLRTKRAKLREWHPDPVRRDVLDKLERIIGDRKDLTIAARRIARFWWQPRMYVWWRAGMPHAQDGVRLAGGIYYDKRNVVVPAAWLLARLGTDGNVASRVRDADPCLRILATPHWLDRVAAGVLVCPPSWLAADERAAVEARQDAIYALRRERERRTPPPEWRLGDMHVQAMDGAPFFWSLASARTSGISIGQAAPQLSRV